MEEKRCMEKVVTGGIIEEIIGLLKKEKCFIFVSRQLVEGLERQAFLKKCFFGDEYALSKERQETSIIIEHRNIPWRMLLLCNENGKKIDHGDEEPDIIYFLK